MRTIIKYVCDVCGKESEDANEIIMCEAMHVGISVEDYKEWQDFKSEYKASSIILSYTNNQHNRDREGACLEKLLSFERKKGIRS